MSYIKNYICELEAVLEAEPEYVYDVRLNTRFDIGHVCELMDTYTELEHFGTKAVRDAFNFHIHSREYARSENLMEFALAIHTKAKEHYHPVNIEMALLYAELLMRVEDYAYKNFDREELSYFYLYKRGLDLAFF